MPPRQLVPALALAVALGGCALLQEGAGAAMAGSIHRPVATSTVWAAPGGNLTTCTPAGPSGDKPVPHGPADTIKVRSKTLRQVFSTFCSFSVPAPKTSNGSLLDPLQ